MKKHLNILLTCVFMLLCLSNSYPAETYTIFGVIIDEETGNPIPGATVKVDDTNKGTYSSANGRFRLPFLEGSGKLKISSLGYNSKTIKFDRDMKYDTIRVKLKTSDVLSKGVQVVGNIEVSEIIRRAIARKEENVKKLKTFQGTLYSKLVFELDGSMFKSATSSGNSISISGGSSDNKENPDKYKMFILETFSRVFNDREKNISHTDIIQRRQTANIQPQYNLFALGTFISFYDDKISMMSAEITTPLSSDAFSYYNYELKAKNVLDDRYIYVIDVKPKSDIYPLLNGTIKIVEGSYELVEVDLRPTESTAISFVRDLHFNQKFNEVKKGIWVPSFLEVTAKAKVEVVKSFMDMDIDINATSIYSDMVANEPLPDSVYRQKEKFVTKVMPAADSALPGFWEQNSLREISDRELVMYSRIDSLVKIDSAIMADPEYFSYNIMPDIEFNRVESARLGVSGNFDIPFLKNHVNAAYSFGLQSVLWSYRFQVPVLNGTSTGLAFQGSIYNDLATFSHVQPYHSIYNTLTSALFHEDYYDYYRREGGSAGFRFNYNTLDFSFSADYNKEMSVQRNTPHSSISITGNDMRPNPATDEGKYISSTAEIKYLTGIDISETRSIGIEASLKGIYGEEYDKGTPFRLMQGSINLSIPTFGTGYYPMILNLYADGGISSGTLPTNRQFILSSRLLIYAAKGSFYSAPMAYFGGTEYFAGHVTYSLTDLWWRALGLPLYEGRGIDLLLAASSGKFFSGLNKVYTPTSPDFYSEVGFCLSRIPTFISNVGYLAFDARWGTGPLGSRKFGWGISMTLPF